MSNTALKLRPQKFEEFIGQEHIVEILKNSIKNNTISHAYLFSGPRGVGKTSTARVFAKALNCEKGPSINPCNKCKNCVEITKGISPDVIEIDAASNRGIDQIREIRSNVQYLPAYSRYKVYIIDEVHMLTDAAFNALLKTLEEPPSHVVFILATTEPHKVKLTIRSRCQHFRFKALSIKEIKDHLAIVCNKLGIKYENNALEIIARLAEGSVRDSLSILDQVAIYSNFDIKEKAIKEIIGYIPDEIIESFIESIVKKDIKKMYLLIEEIYNNGIDISFFIEELINSFKGILFTRNNININEKEFYKKFINEFDNYQLNKIIEILFDLSKEIKNMDKERWFVENRFIYLTNYKNFIELNEILRKITEIEKNLGVTLVENKNNEEGKYNRLFEKDEIQSEIKDKKEIITDIDNNTKKNLEEIWKTFKQKIAEKSPKWIAILDNVKDVKYENKTLKLIFLNPYEEGFFNKENELNKQLKEFFNKFDFTIKNIETKVNKVIKEEKKINIVELIKKEFDGREV
ncbi:MAG TPA: DNA polymerase III subunit gamma/tau [Spirochaetota bacterium]|nr:DNA polymerase III subunit gamma/tau [Spirochaetota bacterium]HOM38108.1 DNA polymerase III subunit gamma/tau [Spirochaetota bacterium]HPQ48910.1 DNA polymerase III subunit gamma/tau [Spirochaetota bacterium]